MNKIIRLNSFHEYNILPVGTKVYQYADGSFLPDEQQPKPQNHSSYQPHISTRYKNVKLGSNGLPLAFDPKTGGVTETDKQLPELYNIRENCCGCSACYAICPAKKFIIYDEKGSEGQFGEKYTLVHGAIYMEDDEEGFLYPVLDASLCIRCYKCVDVCPIKASE